MEKLKYSDMVLRDLFKSENIVDFHFIGDTPDCEVTFKKNDLSLTLKRPWQGRGSQWNDMDGISYYKFHTEITNSVESYYNTTYKIVKKY